MMTIIACVDRNWGIGYDGKLLFDIPQDMEHFKKVTAGKTVIMGRRTFDSLRVKPLPDRRNIVLTKKRDFSFEGVEAAHSIDELLKLTADAKSGDVAVIGGSQIYRQLLGYCDTAYITKVYSRTHADSFIADFDSLEDWKVHEMSQIMEYSGLRYRFLTYKRIPKSNAGSL